MHAYKVYKEIRKFVSNDRPFNRYMLPTSQVEHECATTHWDSAMCVVYNSIYRDASSENFHYDTIQFHVYVHSCTYTRWILITIQPQYLKINSTEQYRFIPKSVRSYNTWKVLQLHTCVTQYTKPGKFSTAAHFISGSDDSGVCCSLLGCPASVRLL